MSATLDALDAKLDAIAAQLAQLVEYQKQSAARQSAAPRSAESGEPCFGNYGRRKGEPVRGAALADLEYYAAGCRRTLGDEAKARFHDKERALLAAIEAEINRQQGGAPSLVIPPDDGSDSIPF